MPSGACDGTEQFKMRQTAHVVEVKRVGGVIRPGDVRVSPVPGPTQVEHGIRVDNP